MINATFYFRATFHVIVGILLLSLSCAASEVQVGPLREKANMYDKWNAKFHQPYYGGQVWAVFQDTTYTETINFAFWGDSCLWTGVYLGLQAIRYQVTKDQVAKENAIRAVRTVDQYLHVTGVHGYIARYWAPQNSYPYRDGIRCALSHRCHKVTTGKYAGDFWEGSTSKDQYCGWFFGMSLAHNYIDDKATKETIEKDVREVVDTLIKDDWKIIDEYGDFQFFSAGQRPTYVYQLSWLLVAYDITHDPKYKAEIDSRLNSIYYDWLELTSSFGIANKYMQYYGHNIGHISWYILLRLGKKYIAKEPYNTLRSIFTRKVYYPLKLSHNTWFTAIFMAQGEYNEKTMGEYKKQLLEDLAEFKSVPHHSYHLPARAPSTYQLDPVTGWLKYYPWLEERFDNIGLTLHPQAKEGLPIRQQCFADFMFQKKPYEIRECGLDDPLLVAPGIDYLAAYWLSVYHGFVDQNQ